MRNEAAEVIGRDGLRGVLVDPIENARENDTVRIQLDTGGTIAVPADMLRRRSSGQYELLLGPEDLRGSTDPNRSTEEAVVPVLAEELVVGKQPYVTGGVRVHRRVHEHEEIVSMPLLKEHVDVRRVVVDREVDGPLPVRQEGDTTVVPIVEEVLVYSKRYVLKEEIHITRTVVQEQHEEKVVLHRQEAEVERLDRNGEYVRVDEAPPPRMEPDSQRRPRRKSILGE
jgi:uncharacterized protein (TIGR02271 family)